MADYKTMYFHLLRAQAKAIRVLQAAHVEAEKLFMDAEDPIALTDHEFNINNKENE